MMLLPIALLACGSDQEQQQQPANVSAGEVLGGPLTVEGARLPDPKTAEGRKALEALQSGRPWRATLVLTPLLKDPARRTPETLLLGAAAAARWGGWTEVKSLLNGQPWLDSLAEGSGRALLARASIETGDAKGAAEHARRAVAAASSDGARAERTVILARALDRLDARDSARSAYSDAARAIPAVADWLYLRAAGLASDGSDRRKLLDRVSHPVAKSRVTITDALARERTGDIEGAIEKFTEAGSIANAMRLRLARADAAAKSALRVEVFEAISRRSGTSEARDLVTVADSQLSPLSQGEELIVARSAAAHGPGSRAVAGFARALSAGLGTGADWDRYGDVLFALGQYDKAATAYARVTGSQAQLARAGYQRGRSLLRAGQSSQALRILERVSSQYPSTSGAADALYLVADVTSDERDNATARKAFLDVVRRFPQSDVAPRAAYRAALHAYIGGDKATAAKELDQLVASYPKADDRAGALYWSGRALATRDERAAAERWRRVASEHQTSYYALRAAKRLSQEPWSPEGQPSDAVNARADSAARRARVLEALGMDHEAKLELDAAGDSATTAAQLVKVAGAFAANGYTARAIRAAQRALAKGAERDATLMSLLYPDPYDDVLESEAKTRNLDPALVASLVRQESTFEPSARSGADARGLMQLLPRVGESIARALRFPVWDVALLYQPDVNLQLGTTHLAGLMKEYGGRQEHVLAAYNAGGSRVRRWRQLPGTDDPEMFVERIPYQETRHYVQVVMRGAEYYRNR
jgi:soluble lytic murein transglycosylase